MLTEHEQYFNQPKKDGTSPQGTDLLHPNNAGHERLARPLMYQLLALPCTF
jgi:lysophospholipase L1-like esterase